MTNAFDHLLRKALEAPPPEPGAACLDAEAVAAWCEGTLGKAERAAAERHAAGCSRCQALLAAMIRIEPAPVVRPWWRSQTFGWLAPLTGAAASLLIWVSVRDAELPPAQPATMAPATVAPATMAASGSSVIGESQPADPSVQGQASFGPAMQPQPKQEATADKRRADASRNVAAVAPPPRLELPPGEPLRDRVGTPVAETALRRAAAEAVAPSPPPAAVAPPPPATAAAPAMAAGPVPALPAPAADSAKPQATAAPPAAPALGAAAARVAPPRPREVLIQSVAGPRWRTVAPGRVERSTDGGMTWEAQATGVTAAILAGAAPSATVCWLVGGGGTVLLTTDGRSWRRVTFPEPVDLVSITATDARTATVVTAAGRRFTTTDGGGSWK